MNDGGFDQRHKQRVHGALAALTSCGRVSIMPHVQLTFLFLQYAIAQHKTNADGAFSSQSSRITLDLHCPLPVLQPFHQPRVLFHQLVEACAARQRQQRVWERSGAHQCPCPCSCATALQSDAAWSWLVLAPKSTRQFGSIITGKQGSCTDSSPIAVAPVCD
jgi:hypothetical protein